MGAADAVSVSSSRALAGWGSGMVSSAESMLVSFVLSRRYPGTQGKDSNADKRDFNKRIPYTEKAGGNRYKSEYRFENTRTETNNDPRQTYTEQRILAGTSSD